MAFKYKKKPILFRKIFQMKATNNVIVLVAKSCLIHCNPMNYNPPGSSVHGISQIRTLEWVAIPFSRASSQLGD